MKRISLKLAVAILAFIIGITAAGLWFIYPLSLNQVLHSLPTNAVVTEEAEEYAVYSAVINDWFIKNKGSRKLLLISNQTSFYGNKFYQAVYGDNYIQRTTSEQRVKFLKEIYLPVDEETLLNYDSKKIQSNKLHRNFNLTVGYILANEDDYKKYDDYWGITLSRVGFNKERNHAFVFVESCCGVLGGYKDHLLLEKVDGNWKIKVVINDWTS